VDKANPLIIRVFIQLLGDGMLTDGKGRTVDFKNTMIIMTSNLGAENYLSTKKAGENIKTKRDLLMKKVCESKTIRRKALNIQLPIVIFIVVHAG
jgi:ATP-dependent Clp protease ATP-binding subunit ClpA